MSLLTLIFLPRTISLPPKSPDFGGFFITMLARCLVLDMKHTI